PLRRRVHREAHERVAELLHGGDEQMAGLDGDDFTADLLAARRGRRVARAGAQMVRRNPEQLAQRTERLVGRPRRCPEAEDGAARLARVALEIELEREEEHLPADVGAVVHAVPVRAGRQSRLHELEQRAPAARLDLEVDDDRLPVGGGLVVGVADGQAPARLPCQVLVPDLLPFAPRDPVLAAGAGLHARLFGVPARQPFAGADGLPYGFGRRVDLDLVGLRWAGRVLAHGFFLSVRV